MRHMRYPISVHRAVVIAMLALLWCGVAYLLADVWAHWLILGHRYMAAASPVAVSVLIVLQACGGTAMTVPFWLLDRR